VRIEIPEPIVTIDMPEPEIVVRMPAPNIALNAADPEIRIEQAQPIVQVVQAEPQVAVDLEPAAGEPERNAAIETDAPAPIVEMGQRPDPVVTVQRGDPEVTFEAADPQVEFTPAGEPNIQINRIGELNVRVEDVGPDGAAPAEGAAAPAGPGEVAAVEPEGAMGAGTEMTVAELVDLPLINDAGEELADIEQVATRDGRAYIVIGRGGVLGIGEQTLVLPLDALQYNGEALVLPGVTNEELDAMEEVDLEPYTILEGEQTVQVLAMQ
jgi:hypothetical protein